MPHRRALQFAGPVAASLLAAAALPAGASAQEITLSTHDGSMTLTGELKSFENDTYLLMTSVGEVAIPADAVDCEGDGCPRLGPRDDLIQVAGAPALAGRLMPALLLGLADVLDADVEQAPLASGDGALLRVMDFDGVPMASAEIRPGGDAPGFAALLAGNAQIALTGRAIDGGEARAFANAGLGDMREAGRENVVALDALAIITAPGNPVDALAPEDVARLFSGAVRNWKELGGPDAPVTIHMRNEGSGADAAFEAMVMAPSRAQPAAAAMRHGDDMSLAAAVAADPGGVGYVAMAAAGDARVLGLKDSCGQVARPDPFAVKSEEYPLSRRLYLYASGRPLPSWASDVTEFALSPEAQPIIKDAGFVDQAIVEQPRAEIVDRLALATTDRYATFAIDDVREFAKLAQAGTRLSVTLRFSEDGTPDSRAARDIPRLVDWLAEADMTGREAVLVGFTGPARKVAPNRVQSQRWAEAALKAVQDAAPGGALDGVEMRAIGLGETAPAVCNPTPAGDPRNDRVEVWIVRKG